MTLTSSCDDVCVRPGGSRPYCPACGNGIVDAGEMCDNGNQTGCLNCQIPAGYECIGKAGQISLCKKQKEAVCGDGILDKDEQCDSGNKPGCTNCKIDPKYFC